MPQCSFCQATFPNAQQLAKHFSDPPFRCQNQHCRRGFCKHVQRNQHQQERNYPCRKQGCHERFHTAAERDLHEPHMYTCELCQYWEALSFHTKAEMRHHQGPHLKPPGWVSQYTE